MVNSWDDLFTSVWKHSHQLFVRVEGLPKFEVDVGLQTFDNILKFLSASRNNSSLKINIPEIIGE